MGLTHESPYYANTFTCNLLAVQELHSLKHLNTEYDYINLMELPGVNLVLILGKILNTLVLQ